jgi:hypothetical protein
MHWQTLQDSLENICLPLNFLILILNMLLFPHNIQEDPMHQALVIFTDASGSGNAAYFSSQGQKVVQTGFSTAQHAELQAAILACQDFAHVPFSLYTDSTYLWCT